MAREIERKWVVDISMIPWFAVDETKEESEDQRQWYIDGARYRQIKDYYGGLWYIKTVKTGFGLDREEIEIDLTEYEFWEIVKNQNNKPVRKTRYKLPHGDVTIELDMMKDYPCVYAEIEFDSVEEALAFNDIPHFFKEEVTNDTNHSMYAYFMRLNDE